MTIISRLSSFLSGAPMSRKRPNSITDLPVTTGAEGQISIPVPDPTTEDRVRDSWQRIGQSAVRQEDWDRVSSELRKADDERRLTPGGMSVAELIAFGARSDVVGAVEHALLDGSPESDAPLLAGIEALETLLCDFPDDYAIALIVALTHIDIAWAWRGDGYEVQVPALNMEAFLAHMDRAKDIIAPHKDAHADSPLLNTAVCGLIRTSHLGQQNIADKTAKTYETLIDLNPMDTRQMRNLGRAMLPRWQGAYNRLELEARRTGARLQGIWGAGGYTWTMLDAISDDVEALAGLDVDYFIDGLRDILVMRPDQFTVNLLAAYCAVTMSSDTGNDAADYNRARIHSCRNWIICDYITELHPLIWAHATRGFDSTLRVRSLDKFAMRGLEEANRVLKSLFLPELARGQNIVFTNTGPTTELPMGR